MKLIRSALLLLCIFGAYAVHLENQQTAKAWTAIGEHDSSCFIEGISFLNDTHVLESCGLYGSSYFHIMQYDRELTSLHETYRSALFPSSIFAEGSILFPPNNIIYMLTYQEGIVYRFNATDFS
jgi:glutamine cyclotransferase